MAASEQQTGQLPHGSPPPVAPDAAAGAPTHAEMGRCTMTFAQDPALHRRLAKELRRYRAEAGLTQKDVADAMDWSPSKVVRIESGGFNVSTSDLRALLNQYGVQDPGTVAELTELVTESRWQTFAEYRGILPSTVLQY